MNPEDFNYVFVDGKWYVGKEDTSNANGLVDPTNVTDVILPRYHENTLIYGTRYRCFYYLQTLKTVFIPNTYKFIDADFCYAAYNIESIIFEENSQVERIRHYFAMSTSIQEIRIPSSLKSIETNCALNSKCLKRVFWESKINVNYDATMFNTNNDIKILVPIDYKYDVLCNITVTKILNSIKPKPSPICRYYLSKIPLLINLIIS